MEAPPSLPRPRGGMNDLHAAAFVGSTEVAVALLARGVIDVNEAASDGTTPLMLAASRGHVQVSRILINKGADMAILERRLGFTALHCSAQEGQLAVTKLLVKAGADLKTTSTSGSTPLNLAAERGHSEVVRVLIEAGANPNSRELDGSTPLYNAANSGHPNVIKVLLRARADPMLTYCSPLGDHWVPLDAAAQNGHLEVARELIQELGVGGCGGASGGALALHWAAQNHHADVIEFLTSSGVVDTGAALSSAASHGNEVSVKFLLQQWKRSSSGEGAGYLETRSSSGGTPLLCGIQACSPRIARALVDAGAGTRTAVRLVEGGVEFFNGTPLAYVNLLLRVKMIVGEAATEKQLHGLERIRRLLMRVEAVHAVSWLWPNDVPCITHTPAKGLGTATRVTSYALPATLPVLRRRAGRPRMLLASLFRHSKKP